MKIIIAFIFVILLVTTTSAIETCDKAFMRGDANGDGILDIGDAIYELFFLFSGGAEPSCLQAGDVNGDNNIDLTDPIYILNFLFKDGPAPVNERGQEEIFGADPIDNAPELAFLYLDSDEVTLQSLPTIFFVLDGSGERDIKHCSVYADSDFGRFSILETDWETVGGAEFTGNDITSRPLEFIIGTLGDGIRYDSEHLLTVTCTDMSGQIGDTKIKIKIGPQPIEEKKQITCRGGVDTACLYDPSQFETGDEIYLCLVDCDTNQELGIDGPYNPEGRCGFLENVLIEGKLTKKGELIGIYASLYNNAPPEKRYGFVTESACITPDITPPSTEPISLDKSRTKSGDIILLQSPGGGPPASQLTTQPCWVEKMTIYRKPGQQVEGFNIPKALLSIQDQIEFNARFRNALPFTSAQPPDPLLGKFEGWSVKVENGVSHVSYYAGYGFLAVATLFKGSDPDSCPEGQFIQLTSKKQDSGKDVTLSRKIGKSSSDELSQFMYKEIEIIKEKSLKELKLPDINTLWKNSVEEEVREGKSENYCIPGSIIWCADDFVEEGTTSFLKGSLYDVKKHLKGTEVQAPKIVWHDPPGIQVPFQNMKGGSIPKSNLGTLRYNFISIVEDSHPRAPDDSGNIWRQRFRCELTAVIIEISPSASEKFKITERICACILERRLEGGPEFVQGKTGKWSKISGENC